MNKKISVAAVAVLLLAAPMFALADTLTRQLQFGMTGSDVSSLQTFLAQDPTIYPQGLVTGYFGALTRTAVSNYQTRNGIDAVGRVGPITLASINAKMGGNTGADIYAPSLSGVTVSGTSNSITAQWNSSEATRGILYYSTSWMSMTDVLPNDVVIQGNSASVDTTLRSSHTITASGLQPNTTYYYVVYSKDASGNATVTAPETFKTFN